MALNKFPPTVLAAAISACTTEPVLLNSDRIEEQFGSYGIDLLASEAGLRRSSLFSVEDGRHICRTYAVVRFSDLLDLYYGAEHAEVLAGNSIGAVFRSNDWDVHKQTLHIGTLALPDCDGTIGELMGVSNPCDLALHIYQLLLVRDRQIYDYATILETHHPDYLTETDLYELYEYDTGSALSDDEARAYKKLALRSAV